MLADGVPREGIGVGGVIAEGTGTGGMDGKGRYGDGGRDG
jgi:hypothetical protein